MGIPVNVTSVLISRIIEKETGYLHNNNIEITHDSLAFVVLLLSDYFHYAEIH